MSSAVPVSASPEIAPGEILPDSIRFLYSGAKVSKPCCVRMNLAVFLTDGEEQKVFLNTVSWKFWNWSAGIAFIADERILGESSVRNNGKYFVNISAGRVRMFWNTCQRILGLLSFAPFSIMSDLSGDLDKRALKPNERIILSGWFIAW